MRLLRDGPPVASVELAITRAILHTNAQVSPADALLLAGITASAAKRSGLPAEYVAATILQESAYDPRALSAAGAIGIAQFELSTAQAEGVDPFDPHDAIDGAAALLASYAVRYAAYPNPLLDALAAYNAGPGAVDAYHGIPPYAETRAYVDGIVDRWAKIVGYEQPIMRP
jgi:soluble lytic murein transglycosylase-like protein